MQSYVLNHCQDSLWGICAFTHNTVGNCSCEFRKGQNLLEEKPHSGYPHTVINTGNAHETKKKTEDSRITFSEIGTSPNSESATAQMISDYLHISRLMGHFMRDKFNGHIKEMHNTVNGNEPRISSWIWI